MYMNASNGKHIIPPYDNEEKKEVQSAKRAPANSPQAPTWGTTSPVYRPTEGAWSRPHYRAGDPTV
jgi:hypothetical protein